MASPLLSRRQFLFASGGLAAGVAGAGTEAFAVGPRRVQVSDIEVPIPRLPAQFDGFTIAHLSDIHFYDGFHAAAERAVELVSELDPDLTIVTGDMVEHRGQLGYVAPFLEGCRGRLATLVTLGNWEYQAGVRLPDLERVAEAAGAHVLVNASFSVERDGARFSVVGLDDPRVGIPDPHLALRDVPEGAPTIWAFHCPGFADHVGDETLPKPWFALAGHTHGGQIRPPLVPTITPIGSGRFVSGWYRDTFAPLYVSRGIGTSGIRARFRAPPEIGRFILRRA